MYGFSQPGTLPFDTESSWIQMYNLPVMCMNKQYGFSIGDTIGTIEDEDVDVEANDTGWGNYLRVRIEINLKKALARGRSINVKGKKLWIPIKYKKITQFMFYLW